MGSRMPLVQALRRHASSPARAGMAVPSRPPSSATATISAAGAVVALGLTGCAAGQQAATSNEFSVVDGVSADIGTIGLRDAGVTQPATVAGYAAKGMATLSMAIVNSGPAADQLDAVSTTAATSVSLKPAAPSSSSPTQSAVPSAPGATAAISIPPRGLVRVGAATDNAKITLRGLTAPLVSGQTISVTFTFRQAGTKTVQLAVKLIPGSTGGETVDVSPSGG